MADLQLQRLQDAELSIPIIGITPLIMHKWSEKAKAMMRDKQQKAGGVRAKRAPKDPVQEALAATYWVKKGVPGMPASAFKAATVGGCRYFDGLPMTKAKAMLWFAGEGPEQLVPITGDYEAREDTPRNETGVVDLRYRNYFSPWSAVLTVRFISDAIDADSILALIDAGGRGGVGDWRPSSPKSATGTYGQYRVDV